jgi:uncharacterized membrane protein YphA (DoxX/SURF4 family)
MSPPQMLLTLLRWRFSPLLARLLLAAPFFVGACCRLDDWRATVAAVSAAGVPAAALPVGLAILAQGAGAVLLAWRRLVWLGSGLLVMVTLASALVGAPIWGIPSVGVMRDVLIVVSVGAVVGALGLAAIQAETEI